MLDFKKAGQVIAVLRKESGYTQEDLSSLLCISPQAISRWENGHTLPETAHLIEWAVLRQIRKGFFPFLC